MSKAVGVGHEATWQSDHLARWSRPCVLHAVEDGVTIAGVVDVPAKRCRDRTRRPASAGISQSVPSSRDRRAE